MMSGYYVICFSVVFYTPVKIGLIDPFVHFMSFKQLGNTLR